MILALDTSQTSGSIALENEGNLVYSAFFDISITHSETLMPQIEHALKFCGYKKGDISALVISIGPGSFTGLRIGLSSAKGIAYGLQIPIYTYNTLEMIAVSAYDRRQNIVSVIDAKMKELYTATYDPHLQEISAPQVCLPADLIPCIKPDSVLVGSGSKIMTGLLTENKIPHSMVLKHQNLPSAVNLLALLELKPQKEVYNFERLAELEPLYLRESTAQIRHNKTGDKNKC